MRRLNKGASRFCCVILLLAAVTGCKRAKHDPEALVPEKAGPLLSAVNVNDPAASAQLVRGFHALEAGSWRWTQKQFEVALKPPPGAAENGARLNFKLNVPEGVVAKYGAVTLTATINGLMLPSETYPKSGDYTYARDVPATALKGDAVAVQFVSDKAIPPTAEDQRELSLIAVSIGLTPK
jgi:hypothetical protein